MTDERTYDILTETETDTRDIDPSHITLSTGVVLRAVKVPPLLFQSIERKFVLPSVPIVWDENKQREIRNPNDPFYQEEREKVLADRGNALADVMMGRGTEIVSIPENIERPGAKGWAEDIEPFLVNESIPPSGKGRYLAWLKYYAAPTDEDVLNITSGVLQRHGVGQEEVEEELRKFPGDTVG